MMKITVDPFCRVQMCDIAEAIERIRPFRIGINVAARERAQKRNYIIALGLCQAKRATGSRYALVKIGIVWILWHKVIMRHDSV